MSSLRTLAMALEETLEDLSKNDFDKFCYRLRDRRTGPRIPRSRLEGKSCVDVTVLMVSSFKEEDAVRVAVEILEGMGCNEEARRLDQEASEISSASGPAGISSASGSAGISSASGSAQDQHFVDKNKLELIDRVTNVERVLDELLYRGVIQQERYNKIRSLSPSHAQIREIFSGPLMAGRRSKDIFYEILQKHEKFLIDDLNGTE